MRSTAINTEKKFEHISYEILFKEHSRLIYRLINTFIKAKNFNLHRHDVDDIYQEVALKIYKYDYISRYNDTKSSFITWLNIICRTTAIDYYRKKLNRMEAYLSDAESLCTENDLDIACFNLPKGVLTTRQTQVIALFYKDGLIAREIANALNITPKTVRSIKFQALERLRQYFGNDSRPKNSRDAEIENRRKVS